MTPLEESNQQYRLLMELVAGSFPNGENQELTRGMNAAFGRAPVAFMNQCLLTQPAADLADLRTRIEAAIQYAGGIGMPWLMGLCHEWMPEGAAELVKQCGFSPAMELVGMAADELLPPRRELPGLDYERARGQAGADAIAAINQAAYGMPDEMAAMMSIPPLWEDDNCGMIGSAGGVQVTCSATFALAGCLYVGWVATLPGHQRRGYAEAVMRHSLNEAAAATGLKRTVLHASPAGTAIYEAMGYRRVCNFTAYALT
jgi:GNAT superfamily N-acetyltransferase